MRATWRRGVGVMATACLVGGWGCGETTPPVDTSKTEATVKGTVTIKGKPASGGELRFDPSNIQRAEAPRSAPIDKSGGYTVKTLVGDNQVTITGPEVSKIAELQFERKKVEVKEGENTIDIKLLEPK